MKKELGKWPTQIQVANRMKVSRGSVSNIVLRLKELGVIQYSSRKTISEIVDICEIDVPKLQPRQSRINWLASSILASQRKITV